MNGPKREGGEGGYASLYAIPVPPGGVRSEEDSQIGYTEAHPAPAPSVLRLDSEKGEDTSVIY